MPGPHPAHTGLIHRVCGSTGSTLGAAPARGALTTVPLTRPWWSGRPGDQGLTLPAATRVRSQSCVAEGRSRGGQGRVSVHPARGVSQGPLPEAHGPQREQGADGQAFWQGTWLKADGPGQPRPPPGDPKLLSEAPARPGFLCLCHRGCPQLCSCSVSTLPGGLALPPGTVPRSRAHPHTHGHPAAESSPPGRGAGSLPPG